MSTSAWFSSPTLLCGRLAFEGFRHYYRGYLDAVGRD